MPAINVDRRELPKSHWISLTEIVTVIVYGAPLCPRSLRDAASKAMPGAKWRQTGGAQVLVQQLEIMSGEMPPIRTLDDYEKNEQALRQKKVAKWLNAVGLKPKKALRTVRSELNKHDKGIRETSGKLKHAYTHLNALLTSGDVLLFGLQNGIHEEIPARYFAADRWHDLLTNTLCGGPITPPDSIEKRMQLDKNFRPGSYSDVKIGAAHGNFLIQCWNASDSTGLPRACSFFLESNGIPMWPRI